MEQVSVSQVSTVAAFQPPLPLSPMQKIIRSKVCGVASGDSCGLFIHGRPGTSKTHMVRTTLDGLGTPYVYINGHVTPIGLFQAIEENPTHVIVLDDLTSILKSDIARQILLAALGSSTGTGAREVRHVTAKGTKSVVFTGGVICIANSRLNERQEMFSAIRDRVSVICYDPTDDQIIEQIFAIAESGPRGLTPQDAVVVATYLVQQCRVSGVRPSLRMFIDRALADFKTWQSSNWEVDWRQLILSDLRQYSRPAAVSNALPETPANEQKRNRRWSLWNVCRWLFAIVGIRRKGLQD